MTEQITTPEALDALPLGTAARPVRTQSRYGPVILRTLEGWSMAGDPQPWATGSARSGLNSGVLVETFGPWRVIDGPDAPTPTPAEAACEHGSVVDQADGTYCASCHVRVHEPTPAGDDQDDVLEPCREARAPIGWDSVVCTEPRGHAGRHAARPSSPTVTTEQVRQAAIDAWIARLNIVASPEDHAQAIAFRILAALGIEVSP